MSKRVRDILRRGQRGFTLIELIAVMGILAVLVAIVAPSVTDARDASVRAQAQGDAKQVNTLAAEFYGDQNEAETRTPHTTAVGAIEVLVASGTGSVQQVISNRWPEKFITNTHTPFQRDGTGLTAWSTDRAVSGSYSALLTVPAGGNENAARVTMPSPVVAVKDVTDASVKYWLTDDSTTNSSPYIILELDTTGNGVGDSWAVSFQDDSVTLGEWNTHNATRWHLVSTGMTTYNLSELKAQVGGLKILKVKVAVGEWSYTGRTSAYVDDIMINGVTYPVGPNIGLSVYSVEFEPVSPAQKVVLVTLLENDNKTAVPAAKFLAFTAVDFTALGGDTPSSATLTTDVVGISVHNFLWLFEKNTSKSGLADDVRKATVFQLTGTEINEAGGSNTVNLTYKRIF